MALNVGIHPHAEIYPAAQQVAVVIGPMVCITEARIGLVITPPRAQIPYPARFAMCPAAIEGLIDESTQALPVDPLRHIAEGRQIRPREAMAQIQLAIAVHRQ